MTGLTTVLHYAPVLPHPNEVEGVLKALTKIVNFLALNYDKLVSKK